MPSMTATVSWNCRKEAIASRGQSCLIRENSGFEGPGQELTGEIVLVATEGIISEYSIASNTIQATLDSPGANVMIPGKAEDPPSGVRLVAITGNVLGSRDRNIKIEHGSRISITGNTIHETEGAEQMLVAIYISGNGANNWVHGNSVSTGTRGHIVAQDLATRTEGNCVI
jgi:hypothetical protein